MAGALFDLDEVLASKQLTTQEASIMSAMKVRAIRDFAIGVGVGSGIVWAATRRSMTWVIRVFLATGAAEFMGRWKLRKSLDSSADHILSLDGSRMQKVLANIIVKKYQDDPGMMQLISKHFYLEEVFDESTFDKPKLQWRYRSLFSDNIAYDQNTSEAATQSGSGRFNQLSRDSGANRNPRSMAHVSSSVSPSGYGTRETKQEVRQTPMNPGVDMVGDPLDCVFGDSSMREEIHRPTTEAASARIPAGRSHRKSRRRRRHHQEVPLDSSHA